MFSTLRGERAALILTACVVSAASGVRAESAATTMPAPAPIAVMPFDLDQVRLLDGPFQCAQNLDKAYLLSLDADRLLHTFRLNVGLTSDAKPYGGWEMPDCELRGHFVGHYLSACALMYRSTGDAEMKKRTDYIVAAMAKCQDADAKAGFHAGYLSAFPESLFDRVDAQQKVWAPWYTMHKIMAGLLDVYDQTGNEQALTVLTQLADWVKFRVDRLTPEQMQGSLKNEQGGMTEVLANLAAVTHNPEYLRIAIAFNHRAVIDPLARGEDKLNGLHANTQIPKIIGAAREYELTGNPDFHNIAEFFWTSVATQRSYAFGGHSDNEHFFPITDFEKHLSFATAETCNTYNMLKLTRHLFEWNPSTKYMDFYERALYNQILASQDDAGMMIYFLSTKPGHFKTYMTPENSFWCCSGTGVENHAKYGDTIYFHDDKTLYVNLYIPSELTWKEKGVRVRQDTNFPAEQRTTLTLHCEKPTTFGVKLRNSKWMTSHPEITVNGANTSVIDGDGAYMLLEREWKDGDVVTVTLPMGLHVEPLPNSTKLYAIMDGPIVLAGDLGADGLETAYAKDQGDLRKIADPPVPAFTGTAAEILSHLVPVPGQPLTFTTSAVVPATAVTLLPIYKLNHHRYTIYWKTEPGMTPPKP